MPTTEEQIRHLLVPLEPILIQLEDFSDLHAGHTGNSQGGKHFRLFIVSAQFENLSSLKRHRLIYSALSPLMKISIHAIEIKALSAKEHAINA